MLKKQSIKKCRGIGKALGFNSCGEVKVIHRYGLCGECFKNWLFSTSEGQEVFKKSRLTGKKKADKEIKSENRRKKIESKSIAQLIQEARRPFQKLIRIRDHGKKCICCNKPLPFDIAKYNGGHYFKAELYTGLIFHPDNVHGQLIYCNKYLDGNENGYRDGLIYRIGIDNFNNLDSLKSGLREYNYSKTQLIELKNVYNKELRAVERGDKNINDVDLMAIFNNFIKEKRFNPL